MGDASVLTAAGPTSTALVRHLQSVLPESRPSLATSVIPSLVLAVGDIAQSLRASYHVALAGTANAFGDDQLNVDVSAEEAVRAALAPCPAVVTASSEEDPVERPVHAQARSDLGDPAGEQYTVAFDPLDGSSIIAPNWSVGAILGVWDGPTALGQDPAAKQVASVLGVFGPRTTALVALRVPGAEPTCFEVAVDAAPASVSSSSSSSSSSSPSKPPVVSVTRPSVRLASPPFAKRYFAPANLRAAADDARYAALVSRFIAEKYTLRYSGGLVPDLAHALVKGHGVYVSPVTVESGAKLRRLYELCPVALVVECAGGRAVDSVDGGRVLERPVADCDERGGLVCGTGEEVAVVMGALLG